MKRTIQAFAAVASTVLADCMPAAAGDGVITVRDIVVGGYMSMTVLACSCLVPAVAFGLTLEGRLPLPHRVGVGATGVTYGVLSYLYVASTRPSLAGTLAAVALGVVTTVALAVFADRQHGTPWPSVANDAPARDRA